MIEFLLSKLPEGSERDRSEDLQTVAFYANTRNSIHNLGTSAAKNDFRYKANGLSLTHPAGRALITSDRSDIVRLCGELVEIYRHVVAGNSEVSPEVFLIKEEGPLDEVGQDDQPLQG